MRKPLLLIAISLIVGCSSTPRGSDIYFSHSGPTAPAAIIAASPKPESIEVALSEPSQPPTEMSPILPRQLNTVIYFGTDLHNLDVAAVTKLRQLVNDIDGAKVAELLITGHTDSRASDSYNNALSQRRASAVADYLRAHQVITDNTHIAWRGEQQPAADNASASGMAMNRRTEVSVNLIPKTN
jgi:outer membrane protein OmpA-like peptidoglycan-associated protein